MNDVSAAAAGSAAVGGAPPAPLATAATVDARNPWLGLASFTEETRAFFFGRDAEVAELARRVQRKLLTVLFGQSGLGKTSILKAGLVPRLRGHGYCPIYVRIDYGRDSPEPAEQIKQAIQVFASRSGEWTQAGVAVAGESLWEFLHHRDDVLRDESGATLIPLLIFDQFEEIFTLAQSDDFGRARAARFIAELADLVENRPPKAVETRLEEDETAAERFDFARSDYRVLIALREDYLAPLESLKSAMPSISQNRLRLAPMTGTQALAAVLEPGRQLVSEEVAAAIVRFVAGGAELTNAVVEPSLLSLICRELNDARLAQGRSEISLDLLAGSHATILSNFYERSLADQPAAVRRIIEDDLLTSSGFRENVAEERLTRRFADAGAAPGTLALLVNRRLLRIEERLDVRRVELTHDVLCAVVKASRDKRQEREAREATERLLAEQRAREAAAHRAAVRARGIAAGCAVLAILAVVAAVYAYFSSQRAQRAERAAEQTRAMAEQARHQAEHLLGYLTDDFARELEGFGRLDVLKEFTQQQIDYFRALPPALQGTETVRSAAMAMIDNGRALRVLGDGKGAAADVAGAEELLGRLQRGGDKSEATVLALSRARQLESRVLDIRGDTSGALGAAQRAAELAQPLAEAAGASATARTVYAEALVERTVQRTRRNEFEAGARDAAVAMDLTAGLGARDFTNLRAGALYAEAGAWGSEALSRLGRVAEVRRMGGDALAVAEKVLERRPGHRLALHAQQLIESTFAAVASEELNPLESLRASERAQQVSATIIRLDPGSTVSVNNLAVAELTGGFALWQAARLHEAVASLDRAAADFGRASKAGVSMTSSTVLALNAAGWMRARSDDLTGAAAEAAAVGPYLARLRSIEPPGSLAVALAEAALKSPVAWAAYERDDLQGARRQALEIIDGLRAVKSTEVTEFELYRALYLALVNDVAARACYGLGDFAAAEHLARQARENQITWSDRDIAGRRRIAEVTTWVALGQARQGHLADAATTIAPVVKMQRELAARNHGDQWLPLELAQALYAQALTDPQRRVALLNEAAALVDRLHPALESLHETRLWRGWIRQAQGQPAAQAAEVATTQRDAG